ncbi:MAG: carbamoyltransferase HypF [Anaerolineae bacterium]|nr:carbamoyltransferase HypF [Anaerolineae bacterium]
MNDEIRARRLEVFGTVQGVGFRPFVYRLATDLGLVGWVRNRSGDVAIHLEGPAPVLDEFERRLELERPALASIARLTSCQVPAANYSTFEILPSDADGGYQPVSPDVALCEDCRRELLTPGDPRYLYPFINCTNCGPRYTIIERVPYDRVSTTMKSFVMCSLCRSQYENPRDRRFHAQPVACPNCGPRVWMECGDGVMVIGPPEKVLGQAADLLRRDRILAIKGLGGFHLAVDATSDAAVLHLRRRKRRPDKALAVMMPDVDTVQQYCQVSPVARKVLTSPQAPIVLLPVLPDGRCRLSAHIAPDHDTLGVMLPYTPLHLLLLREVNRPLVMTSGNLSEEPLATDNDEARRRLAPIADAFLLHDRPIHMPCDDSVVATIPVGEGPTADVPTVMRRARGYAPAPLSLPLDGPQILAVGPQMKATVCLARDRLAFPSQHIGDLDNAETYEHFLRVVAQFERLFSVQPEIIAHDLHPDFAGTRYAQERAAREGQSLVPVQHHHAHALSCIVENGVSLTREPVQAVVLDGTGYGLDGCIWGGEWLLVSGASFRRLAHLRYFPLVGGDAGIRRVDRMAATYLMAVGMERRGRALPQLSHLPERDWELLSAGTSGRLAVPTSSMGRLFDVVAALLGLAREVTYEAQAAIRLETLSGRATPAAAGTTYPWELRQGEVNFAPLLEAVLDDLSSGRPPEHIGMAFHRSVARMVVEVCCRMEEETGVHRVALSGGCFQNRLLTRLCVTGLRQAGLVPLLHRQLPPNDGCVSVGQAVAARLQAQEAAMADQFLSAARIPSEPR